MNGAEESLRGGAATRRRHVKNGCPEGSRCVAEMRVC